MSGSAKVLVTGADGFVGRALCQALHGRGQGVVATDVGFDPGTLAALDRANIRAVACDLTDPDGVVRLFEATDIRRVVHGGALSGPMVGGSDLCRHFHVNTQGTLHLLDAARRASCSRFVLLSSIAAYGFQDTATPVVESAPLRAVDPYGSSKIAAETIGRCYRAAGLPVLALRIASVYGPGRKTPDLIRALFDAAAPGAKPVTVSSHPDSLRQLIHIDDCVRAILLALDADAPPGFAYNVADGRSTPESLLAERIAAITGRPLRLAVDSALRQFDGAIGLLDPGRARRDLGFETRVTLDDGLSRFQQDLRFPT